MARTMSDKMRDEMTKMRQLVSMQRASSDRMLKQLEPYKGILKEMMDGLECDKTGEASLMKSCLMIVIASLTEAEYEKFVVETTIGA